MGEPLPEVSFIEPSNPWRTKHPNPFRPNISSVAPTVASATDDNEEFSLMIIGVLKEIKDHEYRVARLPSAAYQLIKRATRWSSNGVRVSVRAIPTSNTSAPGAKLVDSHAGVFEQADLIVKVRAAAG
jgi:hypothetical protein